MGVPVGLVLEKVVLCRRRDELPPDWIDEPWKVRPYESNLCSTINMTDDNGT